MSWCGSGRRTSRAGRWAWTPSAISRWKPAAIRASKPGIRRIRDRLLAEHLGLPVDAVARGIEQAGSLRAFIDAREHADHTLVRIELAPETDTPPSEALRAAADPARTDPFGRRSELVPPVEVRHPQSASASGSCSPSRYGRRRLDMSSNGRNFRRPDALVRCLLASTLWIGVDRIAGSVVLIPLELLAIAAVSVRRASWRIIV